MTARTRGVKVAGVLPAGLTGLSIIRWLSSYKARYPKVSFRSARALGSCQGETRPSGKRVLAPSWPAAAPCRSRPRGAAQPPQALPQLIDRAGPHRVVLAARHGVAHGTIEAGKIPRLQAPGLALLQPQPHHPDPVLDVVVHRHTVTIEEDGGR